MTTKQSIAKVPLVKNLRYYLLLFGLSLTLFSCDKDDSEYMKTNLLASVSAESGKSINFTEAPSKLTKDKTAKVSVKYNKTSYGSEIAYVQVYMKRTDGSKVKELVTYTKKVTATTGTVNFYFNVSSSVQTGSDYRWYAQLLNSGWGRLAKEDGNLVTISTISAVDVLVNSQFESPTTGATLSGNNQLFTWSNGGSSSRAYDVHVGSTKGANNYFDSSGIGSATSINVTNLPINGSTVYARLYWTDNNWSTKKFVDVTYKAYKPSVDENFILNNDFSNEATGTYNDSRFKADNDWGKGIAWSGFSSRASIKSFSGDKQLRVTFPKGAYGHSRGGGTALAELGNNDELYFRQTIHFEQGFDFVKGGKLPGLASGGADWTGGSIPTNGEGFSARFMWRTGGKAVVYMYYVDQKSKWGDDISLGFDFKTGVNYTITQRIKRNTGNNKNGILQVWVSENGGPATLRLTKSDIRFGLNGNGTIDSLLVTTFHGGGDSSWAPSRTSYIRFDDFMVSPSKFSNL